MPEGLQDGEHAGNVDISIINRPGSDVNHILLQSNYSKRGVESGRSTLHSLNNDKGDVSIMVEEIEYDG